MNILLLAADWGVAAHSLYEDKYNISVVNMEKGLLSLSARPLSTTSTSRCTSVAFGFFPCLPSTEKHVFFC